MDDNERLREMGKESGKRRKNWIQPTRLPVGWSRRFRIHQIETVWQPKWPDKYRADLQLQADDPVELDDGREHRTVWRTLTRNEFDRMVEMLGDDPPLWVGLSVTFTVERWRGANPYRFVFAP